eukprot:GHVN01076912.1.p1 GENE.GHVN01076912.1~~GHVN01076912.1.p1  ORF type:complete len:584 (+),score=33.61 GHVN01076912.1:3771-5522(+)
MDLKTDMILNNQDFLRQRTGYLMSDGDKARLARVPKPVNLETELLWLKADFYPDTHSHDVNFLTGECDDVNCDLRGVLEGCGHHALDQGLDNFGDIFSAVGAFQGSACHRFAANGVPNAPWSVQEIIDCNTIRHREDTAHGGTYVRVADYLRSYESIAKQVDYPYTGKVGVCRSNENLPSALFLPGNKIDGSGDFSLRIGVVRRMVPLEYAKADAEAMIRVWLRFFGPLHVLVNMNLDQVAHWRYNDGELLNTCHNKATSGNVHSLVLVGYGLKKLHGAMTHYWIVRNSWGMTWGNQGYGFIQRETCSTSPFVEVAALPMVRVVSAGRGSPRNTDSQTFLDDGCTRYSKGYFGKSVAVYNEVASAAQCYQHCLASRLCKFWSFMQTTDIGICDILESSSQTMQSNSPTSVMSGPRRCPWQKTDIPTCAKLDEQPAGGTFHIIEYQWNPALCQKECREREMCVAWSLNTSTGTCDLRDKEVGTEMQGARGVISGTRYCEGESGPAETEKETEEELWTTTSIATASVTVVGLLVGAGGISYYMYNITTSEEHQISEQGLKNPLIQATDGNDDSSDNGLSDEEDSV